MHGEQEEVMKPSIRNLSIVAEVAVVLSTAGACASTGEIWDAVGPSDLAPGDAVSIAAVDGRTLRVERRNG